MSIVTLPLLTIILAIAALTLLLAIKGFKMIPEAQVMVIERLGRFHRVLDSGVHIIWPFIDKPREIFWRYPEESIGAEERVVTTRETAKIDLRETVFDFPKQWVITKDNVQMEIDGVLFFQITDAHRAVYEIDNLPNAIEMMAQTTLRDVIGQLTLDETLSSRDEINSKLLRTLDEEADRWGIKINHVELQEISPPESVLKQMERQMSAERERRATVAEAEGKKEAQILDAEGERDAEIARADAERQSSVLIARGRAEARIREAEAEAEAIRRITTAVAERDGSSPINYLVTMRYFETLNQMVSGKDNKIVYMPYESMGVLGAVGGIRDLITGSK